MCDVIEDWRDARSTPALDEMAPVKKTSNPRRGMGLRRIDRL